MATQGTFSTTIAAPPEVVWPWVAHVEKHTEWSPRPYQVELVSGEPNTVGSRYRSVGWVPGDKQHRNEFEITEVVPHERFALRADDPQGAFQNAYALRRTDAGTEVSYRLEFPSMKGLAGLAVPLLFPLVGKPDIRKRMKLLKERVESSG